MLNFFKRLIDALLDFVKQVASNIVAALLLGAQSPVPVTPIIAVLFLAFVPKKFLEEGRVKMNQPNLPSKKRSDTHTNSFTELSVPKWIHLHRPVDQNTEIRSCDGTLVLDDLLMGYQETVHEAAIKKIQAGMLEGKLFVIHGEAGTGKSLLAVKCLEDIKKTVIVLGQPLNSQQKIAYYYQLDKDVESLAEKLQESSLAQSLVDQLPYMYRENYDVNGLWTSSDPSKRALTEDYKLLLWFEVAPKTLANALELILPLLAKKPGHSRQLTIVLTTCEYPLLAVSKERKKLIGFEVIVLPPATLQQLGDQEFFYRWHGGFLGLRALLLKKHKQNSWWLKRLFESRKHHLSEDKLDDRIYCDLEKYANSFQQETRLYWVTHRKYGIHETEDENSLSHVACKKVANGDRAVLDRLCERQVIKVEDETHYFKSALVAAYYKNHCKISAASTATTAPKSEGKGSSSSGTGSTSSAGRMSSSDTKELANLIACWCFFDANNDQCKLNEMFARSELNCFQGALGDVDTLVDEQGPNPKLLNLALRRVNDSNCTFTDKATSTKREETLSKVLDGILKEVQAFDKDLQVSNRDLRDRKDLRDCLLGEFASADYVKGLWDAGASDIGAKMLRRVCEAKNASWLREWCFYALFFHERFVALEKLPSNSPPAERIDVLTGESDPYTQQLDKLLKDLHGALSAR